MIKNILLLLISGQLGLIAQTLYVFGPDVSDYPVIKANYYLFDSEGNRITDLNTSDFEISYRGNQVEALYEVCPSVHTNEYLSANILIDASDALSNEYLEMAGEFARLWVRRIGEVKFECAITACNSRYYYIQDFTDDRNVLTGKIDSSLKFYTNYNYGESLISPLLSGINTIKDGKFKRVLVLITSGNIHQNPNDSSIIEIAKSNNISIFPVVLGNRCPENLKEFAKSTGGIWFESIESSGQAKSIAALIQDYARGVGPCRIEWLSHYCNTELNDFIFEIKKYHAKSVFSCSTNGLLIPNLHFSPETVHFNNTPVGTKADTTITITALNGDFDINEIICDDGKFSVTPVGFSLKAGESKKIKIYYTPVDSSYTFAAFSFVNSYCPVKYFASGGYNGWDAKNKTLQIVSPAQNDILVIGSDTLITWEGVPETEKVLIEYSSDNGTKWTEITDSATGLKYKWRNLPLLANKSCLLKLKQLNPSNRRKDDLLWSTLSINGNSAAWCPDGKTIAVSGNNEVYFLDALTGKLNDSVVVGIGEINKLNWNDSGDIIAVGTNNRIQLWEFPSEKLLGNVNWSGLKCFALSPGGRKLAIAFERNKLYVYDYINYNTILKLEGHTDSVLFVSWSPDNRMIASGSRDCTVKIWNAVTGSLIWTLNCNKSKVTSMCWSPDSKMIASGCADSVIRIWDSSTGELIKDFSWYKSSLSGLSWSPDGKSIASISNSNSVIIWDPNTGNYNNMYILQGEIIKCVNWDPESGCILIGSDQSLRVKNIVYDIEVFSRELNNSPVNSVFWNPGNNSIAFTTFDGTGFINSLDGAYLTKNQNAIRYLLGWSPDGSKYAVSGENNTIKIFDVATNKIISILSSPKNGVSCISWSVDGELISVGSWNESVQIWRVLNGELYKTIKLQTEINKLSISPDKKLIAYSGNDSWLRLWDIEKGRLTDSITFNNKSVRNFCFSPNWQYVAAFAGKVIVWDLVNKEKILQSIDEDYTPVFSWNPESTKLIYTKSQDYYYFFYRYTYKNFDLFDVSSRKSVTSKSPSFSIPRGVTWAPDGKRFTAGYDDGTVKTWKIGGNIIQDDTVNLKIGNITPAIICHDINLNKGSIGEKKDTLITSFLSNNSKYIIRIDSIRFEGTRAAEFGLYAGTFPHYIAPGDSLGVTFSFIPAKAGIRNTDVTVFTQSGQLLSSVMGTGLMPSVKAAQDITDVGDVQIYTLKEFKLAVENYADCPLTVDSVIITGPDTEQFGISGNTNVIMQPGERIKFGLWFMPKRTGRTTATAEFFHNGDGSPVRVLLNGRGVDSLSYSVDNLFAEQTDSLIDISPNPSSRFINISLRTGQAAYSKIIIMDILGREMICIGEKDFADSAAGNIRADISSLMPGIYFAVLKTEGGTLTKPFVVKR